MRPARLELEGFGAFRERTVIDFGDAELIALVGRTGSGKSTLIDAITFALYGCVARYDDKKLVAPVINQTSTRARVQLDFELAGQGYRVARVVQRTRGGATTKEARLEHDGAVLAADARSVTAGVEELLGLDADQFNRTVVLPQGRFADFLHDDPRHRQATLRNLLGLGVYQVIASAARKRATVARTEADTLRPDLEAARARLTDERRAGLVQRRDEVRAARRAFIARFEEITAARATVTALATRLAELDERLALLTELTPPPGLDELERRRSASAATLAAAVEALGAARARRRAAEEAVAAGPDPLAATAQLEAHRAAMTAATEHDRLVARLEAARDAATAARVAADEVTRRQEELDAAAHAARQRADEARAAADGAGSVSELERLITLRGRVAELEAAVTRAEVEVAAAEQAVAERRDALAEAETAEASARAAHDELRDRAGVAGYAGLLRVGEPCPLCHQQVRDLPDHDADAELERAAAALGRATARVAERRALLAEAERHATGLAAHLAADRRQLDTARADLTGVPDTEELQQRLVTARRAQDDLARARDAWRAAEGAAVAHREDPQHAGALRRARAAEDELTSLTALEEAARARRDEAARAVAGLPDVAAVEAALAEARRLAAERDAAVAAFTAAEEEVDRATSAQREIEATVLEATNAARAARDRLAALGPPALTGDGPAAVWHALVDWAAERRRELAAERGTVAADHDAARAALTASELAARELVRDLGAPADGPLDALRDDLARLEAEADRAIAEFDADRARADELAARVAQHEERAEVARQLALHLQTNNFEAWLMEAALSELVDAASVRLRELTAGQFSLALVDQAFMVRDHANADELRSARTLSGGETFLASLSLALALADATADLAPEGSPALESIFLDEGFGSLDSATLDTVAAAIEELGSAGRMVVVVTHIRELADRLPVRFEVTRTAAGATVERVEA